MNCVTECMLRATSIGVGNVVVDMNTTSFNLMWTTNTAYNSSYFITLSANSENIINISANESFVNLILQINLPYSMDIYLEVNSTKMFIPTLQVLWFRGDNFLIQGNIIGLKNQNLTVICTSINNCSNYITNFTRVSSFGKDITFHTYTY